MVLRKDMEVEGLGKGYGNVLDGLEMSLKTNLNTFRAAYHLAERSAR